MRKLFLSIIIIIVVLALIPFTLPNNSYTDKTRYIYTNSNLSAYSVNTNDFSSNGMIYTAFTDQQQNIYFNDINYTQQNLQRNNYVVKQNLPSSNSLNFNPTFNKTNCTSWAYITKSPFILSCTVWILDYFNFFQNNIRLFLVATTSTTFLIFANENGGNTSIIQEPIPVYPPAYSIASNFPVKYDMFFSNENHLFLVYENGTGVVFSSINVQNRSLQNQLFLKYSDYGNYSRTLFYNGKIYVSFDFKIVEVEPQSNSSLAITNIIKTNNHILELSPFQNGVFFNFYPSKDLYLYEENANKTIDIRNIPFPIGIDFVAIDNHSLFYDNYPTLNYISFTYTQTNTLSNETYDPIAYFNGYTSWKNSTPDKYYYGIVNDIEYYQLQNTGEKFLISNVLNQDGLNIYVNSQQSFPDFNPPPFNWIEYTTTTTINIIVGQISLGLLIILIIIILIGLIFSNHIMLSLNERRLRKKAQNYSQDIKDITISSEKKIWGFCPKCSYKILYGEKYCQKCGYETHNNNH